jgi:hypothetical protein
MERRSTSVARRRTLAGAAVVGLGAAGAVTAAGSAAAAPARLTDGQVYLVHGIPGTTADVLLDGRTIATGARPETVVGPVALVAGEHLVTLKDGDRSLTSARFTVRAGQSLDLVAHRSADSSRAAQVVVFRNDLQPVGPGKSRLVIANTAVAPPADVRVNGSTLFHDVAPGEALSLLVPSRTYSVDVRASTGDDTILAPVRLPVRAGTLTRVFAVGDPSDGTADAVVQVLPVPVTGAGRPRSVPTGDGGQAAESYVEDGPGPVRLGVLGAGLLALALTAVRRVRGARARQEG